MRSDFYSLPWAAQQAIRKGERASYDATFARSAWGKAKQRAEGLEEKIRKVKEGYESQMKFCDIDALGYFREFVRKLEDVLKDV